MVAESILDGQSTHPDSTPSQSATIRLLIAHLLCGSVIGKSGTNIKQIQTESNAKVVVSRDMISDSADRVVEVSGVIDAMYINLTQPSGRVLHRQRNSPRC
jgi:heterogeneous nuclear rnp K-like protein